MTISRARNPRRHHPAPEPAPESAYCQQVEMRRRRRAHMPIVYRGDFDLLAEVHDIVAPLAGRVAAEPSPRAYGTDVGDLAAAVHKLACEVVDLIAIAPRPPSLHRVLT